MVNTHNHNHREAHKVHNHTEVHHIAEYGFHSHHEDHGVQENVEVVLVYLVVEGHTPNYRRVTDMDFLGYRRRRSG